jgi:hypothetical protein
MQRLIAVTLLCACAVTAYADVLVKMRAGQEVWCRPALKVYCRNIHVACAGRSAKATRQLFVVLVSHSADFRVRYARRHSVEDVDRAAYLLARGIWDADGQALVLRSDDDAGYVRIQATGRYAERTYQLGSALMAYGQCSTIKNG